MLQVKILGDKIQFLDQSTNTGFQVTFQRTLRLPDDGKTYPLPPGLGAFPLRRVLDYRDRVPASWVKTSGVFLPMYQREAMWISFGARAYRPNAVKVAAGKINAVSGKPWDQKLSAPERRSLWQRATSSGDELQDYLVCPPQPWLDGFNTGHETIRQFVAMPLGMGYTVEGQVTGKEEHGGLQIIVFEPQAGRFPDRPPPPPPRASASYAPSAITGAPAPAPGSSMAYGGPAMESAAAAPQAGAVRRRSEGAAMGLAAGGTMTQKIYPDPHGIEAWDQDNYGRVFVHIVNSVLWTEITGEPPPPSPVTAQSYTQAGYPWYKIYDEGRGDVAPPQVLAQVKSVKQMDQEHGFVGVDDDSSVPVPSAQVKKLPKDVIPDGDW